MSTGQRPAASRMILVGFLAGSLALAVGPAAARAQEPGPDAQPSNDPELIFEREVFQYPSFPRSNPFVPLDASNVGGPRFEQLSLIGVMYADDPSASVAVLSTGRVQVAADGTTSPVAGSAYYLRAGERIGNVTIVEVHRERVVVDVEEFGLSDRRTLEFHSRQGGR